MDEQDLDPDPLGQFAAWFGQAGGPAPEAMAVATATPDGGPSVRMVLMKSFDERGFVFYTNYESRKAIELAANPRAALLFHWRGRQVRIEGSVERTSRDESVAYARSRPRASQLSALASRQSRVIASRAELERRVAELASEQPGDLPAHEGWGGFRVVPDSYEFWQHRPDRLHDRLRYTRDARGEWRIERLAP
jgi:pyridoxamine 5'-phosphate oxidase